MIGSPNIISYVALFAWVPVTVWLFWRLKAPEATIWSILLSIMFLPEVVAVDPPLLPPMDKTSMAALWCWLACLWRGGGRLRAAKPFRGIDLLFVLVLIGNVGTSLTNPDTLVTGPIVRPALGLYDAFALSIKDTLALYLPFLLGRAMIRERRDLMQLTRILVKTGLIYSVLALIEIRLSPQLHKWIYGFYQMDFSMTLRFGGYRPMIFMQTGMAVAMYLLGTSMIAIARQRVGLCKTWVVFYLSVVVVFCKSSGAVVYGVLVWPLLWFVRRFRMWVPLVFAMTALLYPALRTADVFPDEILVEQAEKISPERALSLWFRFDQESQLLERARERPFFGWGGYNRNRIFDETGEDLSVTDGDWAIQIGTRGAAGFLGMYSMLAIPILLLFLRIRRIRSKRDRRLLSAVALFSAVLTVDLLPNGLFNCLPIFLAGAVYGLTTGILAEQKREASMPEEGKKPPKKRKRRKRRRRLDKRQGPAKDPALS